MEENVSFHETVDKKNIRQGTKLHIVRGPSENGGKCLYFLMDLSVLRSGGQNEIVPALKKTLVFSKAEIERLS